MLFPVVNEVWPFYFGTISLFVLLGLAARLLNFKKTTCVCYFLALFGAGFMLFFFRDPERIPPADPAAIVAGADGTVLAVKDMREDNFLKTDVVRISIFLSLLDVHVNRAPIGGKISFLRYYPGKRYFTFMEKSSDYNQHSSILIENERTRCLVNQIVGPVARRVVYWLKLGQTVGAGERIGMMKFGSRLDMYFPKADVAVLVKPGAKVEAGVTVVAVLKSDVGGGGK
ncbi:MAG: phosphatidylserine decarboxylase [Kiritimatiellia bacterium]|nr:phosphatidylserine decarboxylase [Kiritimatiellia bacterium]